MQAATGAASQSAASSTSAAASQHGFWVEARLARDGLAYTYQEFMHYYGACGHQRWHYASQPGDQRRLARNGRAYTYQEFMDYYGGCGGTRWQAARAPQLQQDTNSEVRYELSFDGVKKYKSSVEAMIDSNYRDLCGEDLVNAYAADILRTEQRLQSEDSVKGCRLLRERLQLLRQKTAELTRSRKSLDTVQGDSDAMSGLYVDVYTIFFRAALTGEELGSRCLDAANPSGWSYASVLRSANLNPLQYRILKEGETLDPNQVLADKYPLRLKEEDFDQQGELHLELVRVEEPLTPRLCQEWLSR